MKEKCKKNKDKKMQRSGSSCSESVRAKWFCCTFKLGFVQLHYIFSISNLQFCLELRLLNSETEIGTGVA